MVHLKWTCTKQPPFEYWYICNVLMGGWEGGEVIEITEEKSDVNPKVRGIRFTVSSPSFFTPITKCDLLDPIKLLVKWIPMPIFFLLLSLSLGR